jgi:hypothetical protein
MTSNNKPHKNRTRSRHFCQAFCFDRLKNLDKTAAPKQFYLFQRVMLTTLPSLSKISKKDSLVSGQSAEAQAFISGKGEKFTSRDSDVVVR